MSVCEHCKCHINMKATVVGFENKWYHKNCTKFIQPLNCIK